MTINGLKNTIRYDEDLFRWAISLLQVGSIAKTLPRNKIQIFRAFHFLVMAVNLGAVAFVFKLLMSSPRLMDFLLILMIALGVYLFELPYKNLTASLVTKFIEGHFSSPDLGKKTLLQLGLELEKQFGVDAITDTLWSWTKVCRVVLLLAFLAIGRLPLFLCGAWVFRAVARSTVLGGLFRRIS